MSAPPPVAAPTAPTAPTAPPAVPAMGPLSRLAAGLQQAEGDLSYLPDEDLSRGMIALTFTPAERAACYVTIGKMRSQRTAHGGAEAYLAKAEERTHGNR